jgi:HNH endonuclease
MIVCIPTGHGYPQLTSFLALLMEETVALAQFVKLADLKSTKKIGNSKRKVTPRTDAEGRLLKCCARKDNCTHPDGPWLPATLEFFGPLKRGSGGLTSECRRCIRQRQNQRYGDNWELEREAWHQWYENGGAEKTVATSARRNARKLSLPNTLTFQDWRRCLDYWSRKCCVCGRSKSLGLKLAADHWIPISNGGGTTPDNIVPLCHGISGCNNEKGNRPAATWLINKLGKEAAQAKLAEIEAYFAWVRQL